MYLWYLRRMPTYGFQAKLSVVELRFDIVIKTEDFSPPLPSGVNNPFK